jgi:hypothetical protein
LILFDDDVMPGPPGRRLVTGVSVIFIDSDICGGLPGRQGGGSLRDTTHRTHHVMSSATDAAVAAAAKALEKRAVKAFKDPEVPGLKEAPTTTEKMQVVREESKRVNTTLRQEDDRLQEVWAKVDVDHSGTLDKGEVRQVLEEMGWESVTDEMADEMMAVIDADGSGEVDFDEFSAWFLQQDMGLRGDVARRTRTLEAAMADPMLNLPEGWLEKVLG